MISKKQRQRFQTMENSFSTLDMTMITSTMATKPRGFDLENHITSSSNPYEITDEAYRKMLSSHRRKRATQDVNLFVFLKIINCILFKEIHKTNSVLDFAKRVARKNSSRETTDERQVRWQ